MLYQADETQAGSKSDPLGCPIASPAHFLFRTGVEIGFETVEIRTGGRRKVKETASAISAQTSVRTAARSRAICSRNCVGESNRRSSRNFAPISTSNSAP